METRSRSLEAAEERQGLLDIYSNELLLSNLPVVVSDVFPAYRPKRKRKGIKSEQKVMFPPLTNLQRRVTSPYALAWSQPTLERHFQVFFRSQREVCRVKSSSLDPFARKAN